MFPNLLSPFDLFDEDNGITLVKEFLSCGGVIGGGDIKSK